MKLLAVDTTTNMLTAAIWEDGQTLGEYSLHNKKAHSQKLMPLLQRLLSETGVNLTEIDLFAAAIGPGSFTGIRIGLSCIKGLAQVMNKPVAPVNTLEGIAYHNAGDTRTICVLLDGGRRRVYCGMYEWTGNKMECVKQPYATTVEELSLPKQNIILSGDGGLLYAKELNLPCMAVRQCYPMASSVAEAALWQQTCTAGELSAVYISKPQAEREREERLQKEKN